jgi:glyoxylase-like metal-dependent hydrolase (beta-lactamase superfamily II)
LALGKRSIDKLYLIDCGQGHSTDKSRWSPGEDVGVPLDVSDNCYLIHHTSGRYLLWDTGITDAVVGRTAGSTPSPPGAPVWHKAKTIVASLAELGVKPEDVTYVAVSHTHPDHVGNVEAFPKSMLLVQKAESEWVLPLGVRRFKPEHPVTKLEGDHDVFGDGSADILSTPGPTPGHQSLQVKLPKTGALVMPCT